MKKLLLALYVIFLTLLSIDVSAQINNSKLLENKSKIHQLNTGPNYLAFNSINHFEPTADSRFSSQRMRSQLKLKLPTLNNLPRAKYGSLLSNSLLESPNTNPQNKSMMITNRRLKYSTIWAFTSLNYLYADLVGIMDLNLLSQYQTGVVNGIEITPQFLTIAAAYMQIPLANVFLPQVIKNENTLRWVQIVSGSIATLAQGATLFVGKPQPYYVLFTAIEMAATAYITYDAIKWKTQKRNSKKPIEF